MISRVGHLLQRTLRHPLPWLLVQVVVVLVALDNDRRLEFERFPDTPSYVAVAEADSLTEVLSSHRTIGYPLFLRAVGLRAAGEIEGSHGRFIYRLFRKIPRVNAYILMAAILLFWWSLRIYTGSPWLAFAMATPLFYSPIWLLVGDILTDFLSGALALATIAFLVLLARRPRSALLWVGLTIALFATYQVRPAYLFLVGLIPVLGPVLAMALGRSRRRIWRLGFGLACATMLPLLLFCTLRWGVVRDFRLVPFSGHNALGVAACLLDPDTVESLDRNRDLAQEMLRQRQDRQMEPLRLDGDILIWHKQHNDNLWHIGLPALLGVDAVQRRWSESDSEPRAYRIEAENIFTELSIDLFRSKPVHYLRWVWSGLGRTVRLALALAWIRWPLALLALSLPLAWLVHRRAGTARSQAGDRERRRRFLALGALAITFFLAHALLVVMILVPYDRFVYGMTLLIPPILCGGLFEVWLARRAPKPKRSSDHAA